ncbi:MAG: septum formation inhibitor Maf [Dethiobacter sp.]|jgi:septum formation protein|nr:septum formation inhibitor Maf [Dethiobacter sp.]MBS3901174.1 septum formation inhibitor Maf [Dethiobacter sp.]MBS3989134.1 septum formation inhibitor Maf [Dethiobacter sp.]
MRKLVLASASPRRAELLRQLGLTFVVSASGIREENEEQDPAQLVKLLAISKARAVAAKFPDGVIIAADTVVCLDGELLGKPRDASDAARMLASLSGRRHEVLTGVAVLRQPDGLLCSHVEKTAVTMREISRAEIAWYVAGGEPYDKAGGYGIQGRAAVFVDKLEGCYFNVVGLPLSALCRLLAIVGVRIWEGAESNDNTAPDHQGFTAK